MIKRFRNLSPAQEEVFRGLITWGKARYYNSNSVGALVRRGILLQHDIRDGTGRVCGWNYSIPIGVIAEWRAWCDENVGVVDNHQ